jgi:hypothetical protein
MTARRGFQPAPGRLATFVLIATLAVGAFAQTTGSASADGIRFKNCPPYDASQELGAGPYAVRVHHISCSQGKRVARMAVRHGEDSLPDWSCAYRRKGPEGTVTTCHRRGSIVRFFSGA